jgi:hypothetical protein
MAFSYFSSVLRGNLFDLQHAVLAISGLPWLRLRNELLKERKNAAEDSRRFRPQDPA